MLKGGLFARSLGCVYSIQFEYKYADELNNQQTTEQANSRGRGPSIAEYKYMLFMKN